MANIRRNHMVVYNSLMIAGWMGSLYFIGNYVLETGTLVGGHDATYDRVRLVLLASLVDVVNSATGIADGNPLTALILCIGRLNIAYGVLEFVPEVRPLATVTLMYVAWALGEGIRFLWALARVFELSTRPLTWLRYSSFFVLLPLGFGMEMKIIWAALPHLAARPDLRLALGPVVVTYHAVMQVALALYPLVFVGLFRTLLKERRQVLGSAGTAVSPQRPKKRQ